MTRAEMMQLCLDVSNAAMSLFDAVEKDDVAAPLDQPLLLIGLITPMRGIEDYYRRRNVQRMLALGVSPETLLRMAGEA